MDEWTDAEATLSEMVDLTLKYVPPEETERLSGTGLSLPDMRLACTVILEWLRAQAVSFRERPLNLTELPARHDTCASLINESPAVARLFLVDNRRLRFADGLAWETRKNMMAYARDHFIAPVWTAKGE